MCSFVKYDVPNGVLEISLVALYDDLDDYKYNFTPSLRTFQQKFIRSYSLVRNVLLDSKTLYLKIICCIRRLF